MANTLKLRDTDPVLPGLALPEAFGSLEKRLDSTIKLCKLSSPPDGPLLSVIAICQELQQLLKCAFIENGLLASRMEIFTRYHHESLQKMKKTVTTFDVDHKVTKKQIKRLRKKISVHDTYQRRKNEKWWDVEVRSTDYDSFNILSCSSGSPDLEFMLRVNQILIDFVRDKERTELVLPPMGQEERAELSKLSSIYKLRCRYGKSTQLASSTLMKARQTCIPGHGEVDAILDGFARTQNLRRLTMSAEEIVVGDSKQEVVVTATEEISTVKGKSKSKSPPLTTIIPSTMLTPLSSLTSPTIDMSGIGSASITPAPSPPTSGLSTPTAEHMLKLRRDSSDKEKAKNRSRCGSMSNESPLPGSRGGGGGGSSESPLPGSRGGNAEGPLPGGRGGNDSPLRTGGANTEGPLPGSRGNVESPLAPRGAGGGGGNKTGHASRSTPTSLPAAAVATSPTAPGGGGTAVSDNMSLMGSLTSLHMQSRGQQLKPSNQKLPLPAHTGPLPPASLGVMLQHASTLRPPTVVASPLNVPVSQLPHAVKHNLSVGGAPGGAKVASAGPGGTGGGGGQVPPETGGGEGGVGDVVGGRGGGEMEGGERLKRDPLPTASVVGTQHAPPPKRIRLTRKSAGLGTAED